MQNRFKVPLFSGMQNWVLVRLLSDMQNRLRGFVRGCYNSRKKSDKFLSTPLALIYALQLCQNFLDTTCNYIIVTRNEKAEQITCHTCLQILMKVEQLYHELFKIESSANLYRDAEFINFNPGQIKVSTRTISRLLI